MCVLASFLDPSGRNYAMDSGLEQSPRVNVRERTSRILKELDILRMRLDSAKGYYSVSAGPNSRLRFVTHSKVF